MWLEVSDKKSRDVFMSRLDRRLAFNFNRSLMNNEELITFKERLILFQLILGRAGSGKTYEVRRLLMQKVRTGEKKLLLLVPEQISFENEKAMVNVLGSKGGRVLEITTFTRLVDFVFRRVGGFAGTRLDDGARNMIMSLAIEQVRPYLDLYKRHSDKEEFIKLMVDAIREFRTCGVSKSDVDSVINEIDSVVLKAKLKETLMIMSAYDALVGQAYLDPFDDLTHLYDVLLQNSVFEDYVVVVDSFDGFTCQEMKVLECMMTQAKEFYVTLCTDSYYWTEEDFDLLSPVRKTAHELVKMAQKNCVDVLEPIKLESTYRFCENGMSVLEKNIFQARKNTYDQECKDVTVFNARDIYDEVDYVARTIRKLVMKENVRYREIAIISRTTENYVNVIDNVFKKYDVPVFIERNEKIIFKPLMNLVLTALDVMTSNFRSEKIFKFLKTGLLPFSVEETSVLENYVLLWKLDNLDWTSDFELHPRGFVDKFTENDVESLSLINSIRLRVIEPFLNFKESLTQKSGTEISKSLYDLLLRFHVEKNLIKMFKYFNSMAQKKLADEQIRLWDLLMSILDQMSKILGDKPISLKRYRELLDITISSSEISFIPQELDEVKFGSADRMRPNHPRITFIIGAVQGEFPQYPSTKGIFSDSQRKKLISFGMNVYDPLEKMSVREQFLAYRAITSPSERLYVTWPAMG